MPWKIAASYCTAIEDVICVYGMGGFQLLEASWQLVSSIRGPNFLLYVWTSKNMKQGSALQQSRKTISLSSLNNTELGFSNITCEQSANCY